MKYLSFLFIAIISQVLIAQDLPAYKIYNAKGKEVSFKSMSAKANDVDLVLFLIDASQNIGPGDQFIIESLKNIKAPVILLINKMDLITKEMILLKIEEYK